MKNQSLTNQVFSEGAELYAKKFMNFDAYHYSFDKFLDLINVSNPSIVDAACGPGNISKYLLSKNQHLEINGIDLAPKMIELAKQLNPSADFELRGLLDFDQNYDAIICGFGLPYLNKEEAIQFINKSAEHLNKDGVLYISTMEGNYEKSSFQAPSSGKGPSLFIHYHEASYLKKNMIINGFEILFEDRKEYVHTKEKTFTDLILIARKIN